MIVSHDPRESCLRNIPDAQATCDTKTRLLQEGADIECWPLLGPASVRANDDRPTGEGTFVQKPLDVLYEEALWDDIVKRVDVIEPSGRNPVPRVADEEPVRPMW